MDIFCAFQVRPLLKLSKASEQGLISQVMSQRLSCRYDACEKKPWHTSSLRIRCHNALSRHAGWSEMRRRITDFCAADEHDMRLMWPVFGCSQGVCSKEAW